MSGAKLPSLGAGAVLAGALWAACGGGGSDKSPETAADHAEDGATPAGGNKAHGDSPDSLESLRAKLRQPAGKELDLAAKGWGVELGRVLGGAETLEGLEQLDVSDNDLGPDGARALLASTHWGALSVLDLGGNEIGDAGAGSLASGKLAHLTTLNLSGNGIGPSGAKA